MANVKISQLPSLSSLSGSDVFPVVSGNVTYNVTANAVANFVGGGGGANTGNVTFDNNIVIGTGDDFGGSGLFLAQGPNSVANAQYLRVRAGDVPSHIHLDTGNTEAYDQYFGDDGKYVKLEAGYTGNVVVGTDNGNGAVTWTFSSGGEFVLPSSGVITNSSIADAEIVIEANAAVNIYGGSTSTPGAGGGWVNVAAGNGGADDGTTAGNGGSVEISAGSGADAISNAVGAGGGIQLTGGAGGRANAANGITAGAGGAVYVYGGTAGDVDGNVDLAVNGPNVEIHGGLGSFNSTTMVGRPGDAVVQGGGNGWIGASGNVYAKTSPDGYSFYDWKFDNTGNLTVPRDINFVGGSIVQVPDEDLHIIAQDAENDGWALMLDVTDGTDVQSRYEQRTDRAVIRLGMTTVDKTWQFNDSGVLSTPGNIEGPYGESINIQIQGASSNSAVSLRTIDNTSTLRSNIDVDISNVTISTGTAAYNWKFDNAGNLNIPGNISVVDTPVIAVTNENGFPGGPGGATLTAATSANPGESTIQVGWTVTGNNLVGTTTVTAVNDLGGGILEFVTDTAVTDPFWYNDVYTFTGTSTGVNVWNFGWNGALTLPGEGVVRSNDDTIILQSYDVANGVGRGLRVGTSGQLFLEQGADPAWLSFVANDRNAEISGATGTSGAAGHNISITAGAADQSTYNANAGGSLNIVGGLGGFNDDGIGGPGGDVNITSGAPGEAGGILGNVNVTALNINLNGAIKANSSLTVPGDVYFGTNGKAPAVTIFGNGAAQMLNTLEVNGSIGAFGGVVVAAAPIQGGSNLTVNDTITAINTGATTTIEITSAAFDGLTRGTVEITDVTTPTEANSNWFYQSITGNTFGLFTDVNCTTPVNSSAWAAYTGTGLAAILRRSTDSNVIINANGFVSRFAKDGNVELPGNVSAVGNITAANLGNVSAIDLNGNASTVLSGNGTWVAQSGGSSLGNLSAGGNTIYLPDSPVPTSFVNYNSGSAMVLGTNANLPVNIVANFNSNTAQTWTFATSGDLSAPGPITAAGVVSGTELTSTLSSGNEGGQINLAVPAANTVLQNQVIIDVYQNQLRLFEGGANVKGAYIDFTNCANGVGTPLVNRTSAIAAANTKVTFNNITAQVGGSPIRLYIGAATANFQGAGQSQTMTSGSMAVGSWINVPISTGVGNEFAMSGALSQNGDTAVLNITDQSGGTGTWRVTGLIANTASNLYSITIEQIA